MVIVVCKTLYHFKRWAKENPVKAGRKTSRGWANVRPLTPRNRQLAEGLSANEVVVVGDPRHIHGFDELKQQAEMCVRMGE